MIPYLEIPFLTVLSIACAVSPALVERFDIELFSDLQAKSSNFRGLVLFCIEADFCNQILILQRFSRSTRFAILCTAPISTFQQKFENFFTFLLKNFCKNRKISTFFIGICTDFDEIFSELRRCFRKC